MPTSSPCDGFYLQNSVVCYILGYLRVFICHRWRNHAVSFLCVKKPFSVTFVWPSFATNWVSLPVYAFNSEKPNQRRTLTGGSQLSFWTFWPNSRSEFSFFLSVWNVKYSSKALYLPLAAHCWSADWKIKLQHFPLTFFQSHEALLIKMIKYPRYSYYIFAYVIKIKIKKYHRLISLWWLIKKKYSN